MDQKAHEKTFCKVLGQLMDSANPLACFGAGMVLDHISELLQEWGLSKKIVCVLDNDKNKQGIYIPLGNAAFPVLSLEEALRRYSRKLDVLIACESYQNIIENLRERVHEKSLIVPYPVLNYHYRCSLLPKKVMVSGKERIPKILHYCWFGKKTMPHCQQTWIDRWKRLCPDYEFRLWDESAFDISSNDYTREAYSHGDYAHVSDVVRFEALYRYGGFYLDTDVELLRNLDAFRRHDVFFFYGEWPAVNSGNLCGAVPGHGIIRQIRDEPRDHRHYITYGRTDGKTNCYYESNVLARFGFRRNFLQQQFAGVVVYPPEYSLSDSQSGLRTEPTERTVTIHHCLGSWKGERNNQNP